MSNFSEASLGAKLITVSVVGVLLAIGLCSVGTPFEGHGTALQNFAASAGLLAFVLSVILFLIALVAFIGQAFTKQR